ncbi:MAG: hypothetical protein EA362_02620 [Saprospirales bacterium]|nr:MAG: hypothetical protein EA362_02620 [Saprospirales bacterium]
MIDKALNFSIKNKQHSYTAKIKAYLHWYNRAKTIYDLHSPAAYSLGQLFLKLRKGDKKSKLKQLEAFGDKNIDLLYLTKNELVDFMQNDHFQDYDKDILVYTEDFRSIAKPEDFLKKFHPQKTVLIEGANRLLLHIKAEKGQQFCIPLISYKWKFWRAGFF